MILTLSSKHVCSTVFTNEENQALYKTTHPNPRRRTGMTTTVHKIVPNADPMDMRDQFEVMGEIEWRLLGGSTLRLRGEEMQSDEFLRRQGLLGRKRTFTGPDSRPYRWDLLPDVVVLSLDDESNMEVARLHRGSLGIGGPKQERSLEINPEVEHMLDLIVFTFVYVEKIRMDREKARRGTS